MTRWRRRLPKEVRAGLLTIVGRAPVDPERVVVLPMPADRRPMTVRTPGKTYVSRILARGGLATYEPASLATFVAAIEHLATPTAFDIGANIGVFAWVGASLTDAEIVAAEPTPNLAEQMRQIRDANGLEFVVEELAFGAEQGIARLYLSEATDSSNSLRKGFRRSRRSVPVIVETIDGYVARTGRRPGLLKIDTESTEPDVLRGAAELLGSSRPWIISEVLAGRTEPELMAILEPLGYRWYQIEDHVPWLAQAAIAGDPSYRHLNWLFAPIEPPAEFWETVSRWIEAFRTLPR